MMEKIDLPSLEELEAMRRLIEKYETNPDMKIVLAGIIDGLIKTVKNSKVTAP
jgi:hypothetical protein